MREKRKSVMRRISFALSLCVMAVMVCLVTKVSARAEEVKEFECGPDAVGYLDESGTLTITGTGDMYTGVKNGASSDRWEGCHNRIYKVIIEDGITSIGAYDFKLCMYITSVQIGKGVKTIGEEAFYNCKGLTSIDIPANVERIEEAAFSKSGLTSVKLHEGLEYIGDDAFHATDLKSVVIPKNTKVVGWGAFGAVFGIKATISKGVGVIQQYAFDRAKVRFEDDNVMIVASAFSEGTSYTASYNSTAYQQYLSCRNKNGVRCKCTFTALPIKLTYNAMGGRSSIKTKSVSPLTQYGTLPTATRTGYRFLGWYTAKTGGVKVTPNSLIGKKDCTLYARWAKIKTPQVTSVKVSSTSKKIFTTSYSMVSGVSGYQIRYSTKSNMAGAKYVSTKSLKKSIRYSKSNTRLYVQVRAYKRDSANKGVYGSWSRLAAVRVK